MARLAAQDCAKWFYVKREWKPLNNGVSEEFYIEITVRKDGIDFNKLAYEDEGILRSISFKRYRMEDIPESSTVTFLYTIKPFIAAYLEEEIDKIFANVSPLIKRSLTFTYDDHHEGWDFDGKSYSRKCIKVSFRYTNPPAPKLKSW